MASGNVFEADEATLRRVQIDVRGERNEVRFAPGVRAHGVRVEVEGVGNRLILERDVALKHGGTIWMRGEGCELRIGAGTTCEEVRLSVGERGSRLIIGRDCMLAYDIEIRTSDGHSMLDAVTGARLNVARDVTIGDHVWIAAHAMVLKGVAIGDGSIVAAGAVVSRSVGVQVAVGGNPARVLREGVTWDRRLRD